MVAQATDRLHSCAEGVPIDTVVLKTGFMMEAMTTAIALNSAADPKGQAAAAKGNWNAIRLAYIGDTGFAFVALPQMPLPKMPLPKANGFKKAKRRHWAKVAYDKSFLLKMKRDKRGPFCKNRRSRLWALPNPSNPPFSATTTARP